MNRGKSNPILGGLVLLAGLLAGCASGRNFDNGRKAEGQGRPEVAYDQFCKAAANHPDNGQIADSIARVRPGAAAYWEDRGIAEMDKGQNGEAYRSFLKALDIQPNHPSAVQMLNRLEAENSSEVARARSVWMRQGESALAVAKFVEPAPVASARTSASRRKTVDAPREAPNQAQLAAAPPREPSPAQPSPTESVESPPSEDAPEDAQSIEQESSKPVAPPPLDHRPPPPEPTPAPTPRVVPAYQRGDVFTLVLTLSKRDRSHPRTAHLPDGIDVTLKDTDGDGEVDLDLYNGKERIKKIREITIGRSQIYPGRSGLVYRLTLLGVEHKSRSVRIGIKPA